MIWTLVGILAVILSLRYPAIAVILVVAFTGYNIVRLVMACKAGTAVSGILINGICAVAGIALLIWAFIP